MPRALPTQVRQPQLRLCPHAVWCMRQAGCPGRAHASMADGALPVPLPCCRRTSRTCRWRWRMLPCRRCRQAQMCPTYLPFCCLLWQGSGTRGEVGWHALRAAPTCCRAPRLASTQAWPAANQLSPATPATGLQHQPECIRCIARPAGGSGAEAGRPCRRPGRPLAGLSRLVESLHIVTQLD